MLYLMFFGSIGFAILGAKVKLAPSNRPAIDRMSHKIQYAEGYLTYAANSITIRYNGSVALEYKYLSASRTIYEFEMGNSYPLIKECDSFRINVFKRNSANNTFDQIPISGGITEPQLILIECEC